MRNFAMKMSFWPTSFVAATAALAMLAGCSSSQQNKTGDSMNRSGTQMKSGTQQKKGTQTKGSQQKKTETVSAPKPAMTEPAKTTAPAPKAEAKPVATATAPAPTMGGNVLYYPTGNRGTSSIMVEKMAPSEVIANQPFDYNIKVTNLTNTTLNNVIINETLPSGFNFVSSTPNSGGAGMARSFALGSLAAGQSQTINIKGSATGAGSLNSCSTVSADMGVCATTNVVNPALTITKSAPANVSACDTIPVKIVVTNSGSGSARNVKVNDALPAGLSAVGSGTSWDVGTLAAGQSKEITFNAKADKSGRYDNKATASADNGLNATSNTTTTVVTQPVLAIKAECGGNIRIGKETTCKFTVRNTGDGAASNVRLTATLPAGSEFRSADNNGAAAGGNVNWTFNLAPGESKTVSATVRVMRAGEVACAATAVAACATQVTDRCVSSAAGVPDIGTGIEDATGVVNVGQNHVFTYVVKNQGQVDLTNVTVVFKPEAGLEFVSTTAAGGATTGMAQTVRVGTLKVGQQLTFTITYKGTKAGDLVIVSETTSDQTRMVRNDEQVNFVD
jgi:uncharacterized repeat protein (TIGR01451 family)